MTDANKREVERQKAKAMARWESEGGALSAVPAKQARPAKADPPTLDRLVADDVQPMAQATDLQPESFSRVSPAPTAADPSEIDPGILRLLHKYGDS